MNMTAKIDLSTILSDASKLSEQQKSIFALLNLGILASLDNGSLSATDAVTAFFHADNCLFVHNYLQDRNAQQIMSHGVQLSDLFLVLPPQEAQREFLRELTAMRSLCLSMLEEKQLAA